MARDLHRRKARERQGLFVVEGVRAIEELLRSPLTIRGAIVAPSLADAPRGLAARQSLRHRGVATLEASESDFKSAADTDAPQGILAIAEVPAHHLDAFVFATRARVLLLDGVQDPGNVGTMLRTAAAFDVAATLVLPGTVDIWNAKVVRSAAGALFHRPTFVVTWAILDEFRRITQLELWGADARGEPLDAATAPARLGLVVSNEGSGLSGEARERVARTIAIPIAEGVDSLNVAVAAGILMSHFRS